MNSKKIVQNKIKKKVNDGRYMNIPENEKNISDIKSIQMHRNMQERSNYQSLKYNPDVEINLGALDLQRKNTKYEMTNKRYKPIVYDKELPLIVKTQDDLKIKLDNKMDPNVLNEKINKISEEREYLDEEKNKIYCEEQREKYKDLFLYRNEKIYKLPENGNETKDFDNLKSEVNDYYIQLLNQKTKDEDQHNKIVKELIDGGIFDEE